jgi:hypothetical protein
MNEIYSYKPSYKEQAYINVQVYISEEIGDEYN